MRNEGRVLIASDRDDIHAHAVISRLKRISGCDEPALLFDTATFPMATDVSIGSAAPNAIGCYPALPEIFGAGAQSALRSATDGERSYVASDQIRSVYWRRPRPAIVDEVLEHRDLRAYVSKNSRETIEGWIEQLALDRLVVDSPSAAYRADLKILQLEEARRAGMRIPETLVTNSPAEARRFVEAAQSSGFEVISKSPTDLRRFPAQTELVDGRKLAKIDSVRLSPTIFQHRIMGGPDLRITVVGERLFGMEQRPSLEGDPVDSRIDPAPRRARYDVPPDLAQSILALQRRLGLAFGAFDFKCDGDGQAYFLEVNPVGQWLFVEVATGQPIAEALARYLWFGPASEFETAIPAIEKAQLDGLYPHSVQEEYRALARHIDEFHREASGVP